MSQIRTVHISFRSAPKARFAADFVAAVLQSQLTTIIETAIFQYAEGVTIRGSKWSDFWDDNEGVRLCRLWLLNDYTEDNWRRDFVSAHRRFFYDRTKDGKWKPARQKIQVLWPDVESLAEHWEKTKDKDPWSTGEKMAEKLKKARITPPEWGPSAKLDDDE